MTINRQLLGTVAYWLAWPILYYYLRGTERPRVMIISGNSLLVTKAWLSDGSWSLPGGGQHAHESSEAAARREVYEETGLQLVANQLAPVGRYVFRSHGLRFSYQLYRAVLAEPPALFLQRSEISQAAWLTPAQLRASRLAPDVVQALRAW